MQAFTCDSLITIYYRRNISSGLTRNSEANDSEFLEDISPESYSQHYIVLPFWKRLIYATVQLLWFDISAIHKYVYPYVFSFYSNIMSFSRRDWNFSWNVFIIMKDYIIYFIVPKLIHLFYEEALHEFVIVQNMSNQIWGTHIVCLFG